MACPALREREELALQQPHMAPKPIRSPAREPRARRGELLAMLGDVQAQQGYLPESALREVASKLGLPLRDVFGVATFYSAFSLKPRGKHTLTVCLGTACHVRGGSRLADTLASELKVETGETTADGQFSLETVNCLGCCAIGPILLVDGAYHGAMTPQKALKALQNAGTDAKHEKAQVSHEPGTTHNRAKKRKK